MNFAINNRNWTIKEIEQKEFYPINEDIEEKGKKYYGMCEYSKQIIYLWKDMCHDMKVKTLIHELTHCYINNYITHTDNNYSEEFVCDIVSNSYKIINKIVNDYFNNKV